MKELFVQAGAFRLRGLSFRVPPREYAILTGKTGSGKTTLLESVCGLRRIEGGEIRLRGRDVTRARPAERGIGYVPQDQALFPNLSVREHLAFALRFRQWKAPEIRCRVRELSELLEISHLLDRKPAGLSGGERQRVALGRALSFRPHVLCLDEPLSSLDEPTRERIASLLLAAHRREGITTLHVTHSREEARRLGTMELRIDGGRLE